MVGEHRRGYFGPLAKVFHSLRLWAGCQTVEKDRIGGGIFWIEIATEPGSVYPLWLNVGGVPPTANCL